MTRQNISKLRRAEKDLLSEDIGSRTTTASSGSSGSFILDLAAGLVKTAAKSAGRAVYREAFGGEFEDNRIKRAYDAVSGAARYVKTRADSGEPVYSAVLDLGKDYANSVKDRAIKWARAKYVGPLGTGSVRAETHRKVFFERYLREILEGETYGMMVVNAPKEDFENEEYTENGNSIIGALGKWKRERGGTVVYLPHTQDIGCLIGSNLSERDARAVREYVKGHEILEALPQTGPATRAEHAGFEASYLRTLRNLSRAGNERAREAYRGAMKVYERRKQENDGLFAEVRELFPLERELARAA